MQNTLSTIPEANNKKINSDAAALGQVADLSSNSFKIYDQRLAAQIARIEEDLEVIMNRKRYSIVSDVLVTLKEIRANIARDPLDIQEESTLPVVVSELADALSEYVLIIPHRIPVSHYDLQSKAVEQMFSQAGPWLKQILERMLTNDKEGLMVRAQALSSVFERGARLHEVQRQIRASLRDNDSKT